MATRIMAGRSTDTPGAWSGFDGEQMRKVGDIFMWYEAKLPSWCRIWDAKQSAWVDHQPIDKRGASAAARRAHPDTVPGQAPTRRVHQLEVDEGVTVEVAPTEAPEVGAVKASSGRASDRIIK